MRSQTSLFKHLQALQLLKEAFSLQCCCKYAFVIVKTCKPVESHLHLYSMILVAEQACFAEVAPGQVSMMADAIKALPPPTYPRRESND